MAGRYGVLAVLLVALVALAVTVNPANRAILSVQGLGEAQYDLGDIGDVQAMHRRLLGDLKTAQEKAGIFVDDSHLFQRPLVGSQGCRPTQATDLSAVFTNPSVLATFLSMLSQGLNFGTFPGQALDLPGGSRVGYAPTDDSYCLFATQPATPAPSPATLLPGAPTTGSPLPGEFSCVDASTNPPATPDSFTASYAGTSYVCQGTPAEAPSPIGRNLQPARAPVEHAIADNLAATGLPIWNCVVSTTPAVPDGTTALGQATEAILNDPGGIAEQFLVYLNPNGALTSEQNVHDHVIDINPLADPLWPTGPRPNFNVDFPSVDSDRPLRNSSKELFECPVPWPPAAPAAAPGASAALAAAPGTTSKTSTTPPAAGPAATYVNPGFTGYTGGAATSASSGLPDPGPASTLPVTFETPAGPVPTVTPPPIHANPLTAFGGYLDNCQAVIGSASRADGNFDRNNNFNAGNTESIIDVSLAIVNENVGQASQAAYTIPALQAPKSVQYAPLTLSGRMQAQFCHDVHHVVDVATLQPPDNPLATFTCNASSLAASPASAVAVFGQAYGCLAKTFGLTTEELTTVLIVIGIFATLALSFYVDPESLDPDPETLQMAKESLKAPSETQVGGRSVIDKGITQDVEMRQQVQARGSGSGSDADAEVAEPEDPPNPPQLRRMGFVLSYSSKASGRLTDSYNQARTYVPKILRPQLVSWEQFASKHGQPVVNKLADPGQEILRVADGQIDGVINTAHKEGLAGAMGYARVKARDTLVKQPLYKKAYDSSNNLLGAAQDTMVYKQTVKRFYPVVAPIAAPAINKIQPYCKATVEYWKPLSAAA